MFLEIFKEYFYTSTQLKLTFIYLNSDLKFFKIDEHKIFFQACGGSFHYREGSIVTPNYGQDYPNNAECLWDLYATDGYSIHIHFTDRFHLEESKNCENDFLEVKQLFNSIYRC